MLANMRGGADGNHRPAPRGATCLTHQLLARQRLLSRVYGFATGWAAPAGVLEGSGVEARKERLDRNKLALLSLLLFRASHCAQHAMIEFAVIHAVNVRHVHAHVLLMIMHVLLDLSTEHPVIELAVIHSLDV
jgi:hypothetical protein